MLISNASFDNTRDETRRLILNILFRYEKKNEILILSQILNKRINEQTNKFHESNIHVKILMQRPKLRQTNKEKKTLRFYLDLVKM